VSFRGAAPISGLPEIGTYIAKSAKADLVLANPESSNHRRWLLE